jgi:pyruvate/2-oxoglutarate dehydrogenase complex dihydrolipoamide acyltransferase (E2) component
MGSSHQRAKNNLASCPASCTIKGIDLLKVQGTSPGGRIVLKDLEASRKVTGVNTIAAELAASPRRPAEQLVFCHAGFLLSRLGKGVRATAAENCLYGEKAC